MAPHQTQPDAIGLIGFGEAAMAFVSGWGANRPATITAYDIKPDLAARYAAQSVKGGTSPAAIADAPVIFSLVTADQALAAAQQAAPHLQQGCLWFDCNSCAPRTKQAAAQVIDAAGGRYVDVAVMAPVHPKRHLVPLLVSGPHQAAACAVLESLSMKPVAAGDTVGQASSIKMLRSVMVKGIEALSAECFLAARRAGVDDAVLASLEASDPAMQWPQRAAYNLERMVVHGARRAAEMREVALTLADLGLPDRMAAATVAWQQDLAGAATITDDEPLTDRLDNLLKGR